MGPEKVISHSDYFRVLNQLGGMRGRKDIRDIPRRTQSLFIRVAKFQSPKTGSKTRKRCSSAECGKRIGNAPTGQGERTPHHSEGRGRM